MTRESFNFKVSVIVPVYNAAKFVRKAVESAVHVDEVGEIILIEDASPDNALEICTQLEKEYDKVILFRHPNGENRGAGASRNLGIVNASCEYVAFLDADDYYLSNRFEVDKIKFQDRSVAGVYNAVVNVNLDKADFHKIYTIIKPIDPDKLFHYLLRGTYGHFHTNGVTLKKDLLDKLRGFKTDLPLHQDSELWLRCALAGKIVAGCIAEPTSVVVTHGSNRITSKSNKSKLKYWLSLMEEVSVGKIGPYNYLILLRNVFLKMTSFMDILNVIRRIRLL
ncbi:glycosyltransferase family 2 protein [Pontibacter flavimaris]|uniref:Glycosyltransferase 2-like domain-containing protein n=1 Tax=Pontibacter flavimaris TaxID=1797110 RepID=A0A1Q5PCF4_9BACT|nr:glycosyltransferase family 2 protein [Pontibacter flavimaris]OKL39877.1 hypothetical protein A3841_15995 [Pontibacter flavimaris]